MNSTRTPNTHGLKLTTQLRMLRERAGLTQEEAGQALGGSRYQVNRIENGRVPGHDELLAMLDVYAAPSAERASYLTMWKLAWEPDGRRIRRQRLGRSMDSQAEQQSTLDETRDG
jgi:transcriptional regulator with XRE-family HTH domain